MSSFLEGRKEKKRKRIPPMLQHFAECRLRNQALDSSVSPIMILCIAYPLAGCPIFFVGPRDMLTIRQEEVRPLRAQGSPQGQRSHCGQWARGSLLLHISPVEILEHRHGSRCP